MDKLRKYSDDTIKPALKPFEGLHITSKLKDEISAMATRLLHEAGYRELKIDVFNGEGHSIICSIREMTKEEFTNMYRRDEI